MEFGLQLYRLAVERDLDIGGLLIEIAIMIRLQIGVPHITQTIPPIPVIKTP